MTAPTALYDAKRAVFYVKPTMRGWLHLLWFSASLVCGTVLIARAHGAARPPGLPRAGWGMAEGAGRGAVMIAGGLLSPVGLLALPRRWPDPVPAVFGYHEVFHACVCAAAACQFIAIAMFTR